MKLKEITFTKTIKTQDPTSSDRFSRVEVGVIKTFSFEDKEKYNTEEIKETINKDLSILLNPDPSWIDKKHENEK